MKLLVAIPTYNRAEDLDKAIGDIARARSMTQSCEVELYISDNCSSDHTQAVVLRWRQEAPWIHYRRWVDHVDTWGPTMLWRALLGSRLDYEYIWLLEDEAHITDPLAFEKVAAALEAISDSPPALIHCCQTQRALPGDQRIAMGSTEELCNTFGWHDLLGWISSLIISKETVQRMFASPHCEVHPVSALWHSEVILEAAYGKNMMVLTEGLISPHGGGQSKLSNLQGDPASVGPDYWYVIAGLHNLKERAVFKIPLNLEFFRWLDYSLWDRLGQEVVEIASSSTTTDSTIETQLYLLGGVAELLGHEEERNLYVNWLNGFCNFVRSTYEKSFPLDNPSEHPRLRSYSLTLLPSSNETVGED